MRKPNRRGRRGVSMLLVLISVMTATIICTGYLASRDNSAAIGANVTDASAAKWGAASGIRFASAVLETEIDWASGSPDGRLIANYPIGGASVTVDLVDLDTNEAPTAESIRIGITSTAARNGIEQVATAMSEIDPATREDSSVDISLAEFAVFAADKIKVKEQSTITRWSMSPAASRPQRLAIGTRGTNMQTVQIDPAAAALDTTVWHGPGASSALVGNSSGLAVNRTGLLDRIPLPSPPDGPSAPTNWANLDDPSNDVTLTQSRRTSKVVIKDGRVLRLEGPLTLYSDNEFKLERGAGVEIVGNVVIVTRKELDTKENAFIELMDENSSLTMHVRDYGRIADTYVGDVRADRSGRDNTGAATYMNPSRIRFFSVDGSANWEVNDQSVIKGSLYVPSHNLYITGDSALYGRVAAKNVELQNASAIFYDPALNRGVGYTNPNSKIYASGRISPSVTSVTKLSVAALAQLSENLGVGVVGDILGGLFGGGPNGGAEEPPLGPNDPTPRTVSVTTQMQQIGFDAQAWEDQFTDDDDL